MGKLITAVQNFATGLLGGGFGASKADAIPVRVGAGRYDNPKSAPVRELGYDQYLFWVAIALLLWGCVMVYSTTIALNTSPQFANYSAHHFIGRHIFSVGLALAAAWFAFRVPMATWYKLAPYILLFALVLLIMVLIPGVGKGVKGARRWLPLGLMNFQPSELAKVAVIFYIANYIVRRVTVVQTNFWKAVLPVAGAVGVVCGLLAAEPDLGAAVVIGVVSISILFIGGINARVFFILVLVCVIAVAIGIFASEWRRERVLAFLNPWGAKYALGKGYQLTQALIAIGRGGIFGVGLGASVEKLHWLPEAHTDFILAIIGEEFGLVGIIALIVLFFWLIKRIMHIGRQAIILEQFFSGLVAQGIGVWLGFQTMINMGVNLGALPTKGLTLPLMSYGGSAILMMVIALAVVLRVDYENRAMMQGRVQNG